MCAHRRIPPPPRSPRGTAEIELLLVIPLLLTILFIIGGMLLLGPARILNVFQSSTSAYQDATAAQTPGQTPDVDVQDSDVQSDQLEPTGGLDDLQPANRIHQATPTKNVTIKLGNVMLPTVTLTDKAEFAAPAWSYSSWPVASDQSYIEQWVNDYAAQSTAQWQDPLELQPPFPP